MFNRRAKRPVPLSKEEKLSALTAALTYSGPIIVHSCYTADENSAGLVVGRYENGLIAEQAQRVAEEFVADESWVSLRQDNGSETRRIFLVPSA